MSQSIQVFPKALQCKGSCLSPATALELLYLKVFKAFIQREVTHQKAQKHKLERFFSLRFFFSCTRHSRHTYNSKQLDLSQCPIAALVKLHHTYIRDPACGRLRALVCLSNGVLLYVSKFPRYLINFSTI